MEQKHVLLSAVLVLGLGVGLGIWVDQIGVLLVALRVGIGLYVGLAIWAVGFGVGGDHVSNQISSKDQIVMEELMKLVIDGKDSEVTFDKFPYYLSERIKTLLTNAGYFHLKQHDSSKHMRNLLPVSRAILLSGPAEFYHEELAKALAHYFESKLLFLDVNYFFSKMQAKYGCPTKEPYFKRSISEVTLECMSGLFSSLSILPSTGAIRGSVFVLGSRQYGLKDQFTKTDEKLTMLFPYYIDIKLPLDEAHIKIWKSQLKEATKKTQLKDYTIRVAEVLAANDLDCDDLDTINHTDMMLLSKHTEEIVALAIFNHLMDTKNPEYRNGIRIISAKSLCDVLSLFQEGESGEKDNKKTKQESEKDDAKKDKSKETKKDSDIKASAKTDDGARKDKPKGSKKDSDVKASTKADDGAGKHKPEGSKKESDIKASTKADGGAGKDKPKGSKKDKASTKVDTSCSDDLEEHIRQELVAPTIIFIDEVDSMLGQRSAREHDTMRRVKNEFMSRWDGLLSKPDDRIIVLGATNMPFDLDEAIIRRFQRSCNHLNKDKHSLSSSSLNLCMTAAYRPLKELIQQEKEKEMENKKKVAEAEISKDASNDTKEDQAISLSPLNMEDQAEISKDDSNATEEVKEDQVISLGPLNMEDQAEISKDASNATEEDKEDQVAASFAAEGSIMNRLKEWNNLFGEGGSRKKEEQLSYFL
ncbi:hypothetical protein TSUD_43730 [Trifolium subterraneum]|uniref:Uncharacterized protein n=1 Tax=Trifolium subterraneum TaxID=3900 RepID=A0A2Z6MLH7_TRISU|nr:hypothetical protein TSUD_43730 [Trifolium subterraneum]